MSAFGKLTGRLRGGLSRTADLLRLRVKEDAVYAAIGGVIGVLGGWLFAALWIR